MGERSLRDENRQRRAIAVEEEVAHCSRRRQVTSRGIFGDDFLDQRSGIVPDRRCQRALTRKRLQCARGNRPVPLEGELPDCGPRAWSDVHQGALNARP